MKTNIEKFYERAVKPTDAEISKKARRPNPGELAAPTSDDAKPAPSPFAGIAEGLVSGDNNLRRFAEHGYREQHTLAVQAVEFEFRSGRPVANEFLLRLYQNLRDDLLRTTLGADKAKVQRLLPTLLQKPAPVEQCPPSAGYFPQN